MLRGSTLLSPSCRGFNELIPKMNSVSTLSRQNVMVQASGLFPTPPSVKGQLGSKYAVIEVGGGQQIVEEGRSYSCNRLKVPPGSLVKLPRVIALKSDGVFEVGEPYLDGVTVEAEIEEEYRGKKIIVFKYRPKKHYRKKQGHRQDLTRFKVTKITKE